MGLLLQGATDVLAVSAPISVRAASVCRREHASFSRTFCSLAMVTAGNRELTTNLETTNWKTPGELILVPQLVNLQWNLPTSVRGVLLPTLTWL